MITLFGIALLLIVFGLVLNFKNRPTNHPEPDAIELAQKITTLGVMLLFVAPFLVLF